MSLTIKLLLVYLIISPSFVVLAARGNSYYDILGISPKATQAEIKKAFRRMSQKYHPDISKEKDATDKFSKINVAYEALSDPEKRRIYDSSGEEGLRQHLANQSGGGGGGMDPFGDLFSQFFGGGGGGRPQRRDNKGPELFLKIRLTLEDIYNGKEINVWHTKQTICHHCRGSGADNPDDVRPCPECNGTGQVIKRQQVMPGFYSQFQGTCERCHGKGKTFKTKCHVCKATKVVDGVDDFTIFVEKGIPDKHILKFPGQGNEYPDKAGSDINFQIIEMPHSRFTRKGKNLHMKLTLTLEEALLGFDRDIVHLDGHVVKLEKTKITQPGDIDKIKGEGMPIFEHSSEYGDLFVEYRVEFPTHFSPEQMTLWREFFKDK